MPRYDYHCESNGRTVEVSHPMSETVSTWGEVCERTGEAPGKTPPGAPVEKMLSLPFVGDGTPRGWSPTNKSGGRGGGHGGGGCGAPGCCRT